MRTIKISSYGMCLGFLASLAASACFYDPTGVPGSGSTGAGSSSTSTSEPTSEPTGAAMTGSSTVATGEAGTGSSTTATSEAMTGSSTTLTSDTTKDLVLPEVPMLTLAFSQIKQFNFEWGSTGGADYYQLWERAEPGAELVQLGADIMGESVSWTRPLHFRFEASYILKACNGDGCTDSAAVDVVDSLVEAVGYLKASNTDAEDWFGLTVALSDDGDTLAVAAHGEDSIAIGIGGSQVDNSATYAGAVYVFVRDADDEWSQQAYIKASNTGETDLFGVTLALSGDGNTLAVGAYGEGSAATGIGGSQSDNSALNAGAVYVFVRGGIKWSQQAYVKASNTDAGDRFGITMALSGDGNTLAVGADFEGSAATGIGGKESDNFAADAGAVYVFVRGGDNSWSQQAYVKASNTGGNDLFGGALALSYKGDTLAVGADGEGSAATVIGGDESDDAAVNAGAVYVFVRDANNGWSQQAYVKASNAGAGDEFGASVALSDDGNTLAVGANYEDSAATGVGGDPNDDTAELSGAIYVFVRDGNSDWSQQAYVKASNTGVSDQFGLRTALSGDGNTLAVSSHGEDGAAIGIGGNEGNDFTKNAGAVYVFVRDANKEWSQQAYVKASNTGTDDKFGRSLALSGDGDTLAVGAASEGSAAKGFGGDQSDNAVPGAGAIYLF